MPMNQKKTAKFWQDTSFPIAVAHRGGDAAGIEKENSLKAFQAAYDIGYRWFETDVVPTKDGKLLVIHGRGYQLRPNKDLPSRLKVQSMTYAEALECITVGGEKPLRLEELLDAFPEVKFFLDPKTLKAASALARSLINRPQDLNRVRVGSFIPFNNARVYRMIKRATGKEVSLTLLGPLKSMPIKLAAILPILKPVVSSYIRWTRAESIHVPHSWIAGSKGKKIVQLAHESGSKVGVYTPNSKEDIEQSLASGAEVIMSDNIRLLKRIVKS